MKKYLPTSLTFSVNRKSSGFTLIELLIAITIITILAVAVYAALNPAQRLKDAKDAKRGSDVNEILSSIHQSIIDNKGTLPTNLNSMTNDTEQQLGTGNSTQCVASVNATYCSALTTVCVDLMTGTQNVSNYLASMPIDPIGGTTANATFTGYSVKKAATGIITVRACRADGSAISVSR